MTDDIKSKLKEEIFSLKRKLGLVTLVSVVFGGGGLFSGYKWFASEKKLAAAELRKLTIETEIAKNTALNQFYEKQIASLETQLEKNEINLSEYKSEVKELRDELDEVNDKHRQVLPGAF